MAPDLYQNMGGVLPHLYKYALYPQIYPLREPGTDSFIKKHPFPQLYCTHIRVQSPGLGRRILKSVMLCLCKLLETKSPMSNCYIRVLDTSPQWTCRPLTIWTPRPLDISPQ